MKYILLLVLIFSNIVFAASNSNWNGKQAVVVLSYDDAINEHLDLVIPALNKYGFSGTFYLKGDASAFNTRIQEWRAAATANHELGNHTLHHPCIKKPTRKWVKDEYNLASYSLLRLENEIAIMNTMLKMTDGLSARTFAYTCGETTIKGDASYISALSKYVIAARTVKPRLEHIDTLKLFEIGAFSIAGKKKNFEYMKNLVDQAIEEQALLVFLFHGVGGGHALNTELLEHNKLLDYLHLNKKQLWVAPLKDVAQFVNSKRKHK